MTVATTTNRVEYTADGVLTTFAYPFKIFADGDLEVFVAGVKKTLTTDYTVTGAGAAGGGNVVFVTAPANLASIVILRTLALTQGTDLVTGGALPANSLEDMVDRNTMITQQLDEKFKRAALLAASSLFEDLVIPEPVANQILGWNASADNLALFTLGLSEILNVMTAKGDIIQGGDATGAPQKLGIGTEGLIAKVASGLVSWGDENLIAGQCRLTKSGANLLLSRFNGKLIPIKIGTVWSPKAIPSAGITLASTGLAVDTNYFIYLFDSAGTLTLEASTTGHSTDTDTGVEIKTGDATRTLVGLARTDNPLAWIDTAAKRFVISYFNRQAIPTKAFFSAVRSTSSATFVELNTEIRNAFVTWGDEAVSFFVSGACNANAVVGSLGMIIKTALSFDAGAVEGGYNESEQVTDNAVIERPVSVSITKLLSEGFHDCRVQGLTTDAGTQANWSGGATDGQRTTLMGMIRG